MTADEIDLLERELSIQLPEAYRHRMQHFPIGVLVGNTSTELWDDATALIKLNQELQQPGVGWPNHLFALGRDAGGCAMALDLRDEPPTVFWTDRCLLDSQSSEEKKRFDDWLIEWVRDMTADLLDQGVDPTASPELLAAREKVTAKDGFAALASFGSIALSNGRRSAHVR